MTEYTVTHWIGIAGLERPVTTHIVEASSPAEALDACAPASWPREDSPNGPSATNPDYVDSRDYSDCWIVDAPVPDED